VISTPAFLAVAFLALPVAGYAQGTSVETLVSQLRSSDPASRAKGACDLKELGRDAARAIPQLIEAMADATPVPRDVCGARNWSWRRSDDDTTTPGREAASALVSIGDGRASDALLAALKDSDTKVRRQAAWALSAGAK
jgi:HEAT repeat protein